MDDSTTYLAHHGIPGQKWGVRRYQNKDGSLTAEGRKRRGLGEARNSMRERFAKKRQEKAVKNAKTAEQEKEELKEYLRKHPKKLPKYSRELTQEDANEIISNIQFDRRLKDIKKQEYERVLDKVRTTTNTIQTVGNLINAGKSIYNSYVEVNNALIDAGKIVGTRQTKIGEKPEDLSKKAHAAALDIYLRNHTAEDFSKDRASWSVDDTKTAKQYYDNIRNLEKDNKGNNSGTNYDQDIQDLRDIIEDLQSKIK